jgi:chloride channel 7
MVITAVVAVLAAAIGAAIIKVSTLLINVKFSAAQSLLEDGNAIGAHAVIVIFGIGLAAVASVMVAYVAPASCGSGLPIVKSYLNGIEVDNGMSVKVLLTRALGLTLSSATGLFVGKEGPIVHISCCIAVFVNDFARKLDFTRMFAHGTDPKSKMTLVSIAIALGVAAAFRAPIGGILFALEETTLRWTDSTSVRAFFGAGLTALLSRW